MIDAVEIDYDCEPAPSISNAGVPPGCLLGVRALILEASAAPNVTSGVRYSATFRLHIFRELAPKEKIVPIYFASEPKNGTALVKKGIRELSKRLNPFAEHAVNFQISQPYAVYDVRDDDAVAGGFLASATLSGFRYLVTEGGDLVAVAEVHVDRSGAATLLTHINCGSSVAATSYAFGLAALLMPVDAGLYEARLLRYSAIALMALWLKPDAECTDLFYPLAPAPNGIHTGHPYSTAEFLWAIHSVTPKRTAHKGAV